MLGRATYTIVPSRITMKKAVPRRASASQRRGSGTKTARSLLEHALEVVEGRLPALPMRALGFVVREPGVRQDEVGCAIAPIFELDLDQLMAFMTGVSIPAPPEDEALGGFDLDVLAAAPEFLALWAAHHEPQPAADTWLDLRDRCLPIGASRPPAPQHLGVEPGVEDDRPGRLDHALDPDRVRPARAVHRPSPAR